MSTSFRSMAAAAPCRERESVSASITKSSRTNNSMSSSSKSIILTTPSFVASTSTHASSSSLCKCQMTAGEQHRLHKESTASWWEGSYVCVLDLQLVLLVQYGHRLLKLEP